MQRLTILFLAVYSVVFSAAVVSAQTPGPADQSGQIGYHEDPNTDKRRTLLLKDFNPATMMRASVQEISKAKFYVIDVHNHVNDAARIDEHGQGRWKIYGMGLPDSVLEKVYHKNAERVFAQFKGAAAARKAVQ